MNEKEPQLPDNFARFTRLAAAVLWVEAAAIAFWPVLTLAGGFLAIALLGITAALPPILHFLVLFGFVAVAAFLVWSGRKRFSPPPRNAEFRRIEHDSGLRHRPFETLADRPVGNDAVGTQFWLMHQKRIRAQIHRLRLSPPDPGLPARDPWALRLLVTIALVLGFVVAGPRSGHLIVAALTTNLSGPAEPVPVEAWIKPPAYTGRPPILLKAGDTKPIPVPTGSTVEAHVTGGTRTPRILFDGKSADFKPIDGGGFSLTQIVSASGTLSIRRGWSTLAQWHIAIIEDQAPTVSFEKPPSPLESGALKIDYRATDDYGVMSVTFRARKSPAGPDIAADPIETVLSSGQPGGELRGTSFQDFTAHPWAGMEVVAKLVATDSANHTGESPEISFTLPERNFLNPVARTIIAIRKHVIFHDRLAGDNARAVAEVSVRPDSYGGDLSVFLALRSAALQLIQPDADTPQAAADIEDLLWNAALKIEDGNRPEAEKALRVAEDALEKALQDPSTTPSEIARLTQALKEAVDREIKAMAENLRAQLSQNQQDPNNAASENGQMVDQQDLNDQIDKMNQMAQDGSRAAAQQMLDDLKSLLENMKAGMAGNKAYQQGMKSLQQLKDLAAKQRELEKSNEPGAAQNQESLRQKLGSAADAIGETMGDIPPSLGEADKAMRSATQSLKKGARGEAEGHQEDAAGELDDAAKALSQQLSEMGRMGLSKNPGGKDPLGRGGREARTNDKMLPTDRERQRSREILNELQRRSGEHERSRQELDYLLRLLQY